METALDRTTDEIAKKYRDRLAAEFGTALPLSVLMEMLSEYREETRLDIDYARWEFDKRVLPERWLDEKKMQIDEIAVWKKTFAEVCGSVYAELLIADALPKDRVEEIMRGIKNRLEREVFYALMELSKRDINFWDMMWRHFNVNRNDVERWQQES